MLGAQLESIRAAGIVLASSSPRRVDIINNILGLGARVVPSTFPEDLDKSQFSPRDYVAENARRKALEVYERLEHDEGIRPSLVIGADTVIDFGGRILEKPKSEDAACEMLASLSGKTHYVRTGVALIYAPLDASGTAKVDSFVEVSEVRFAVLTPEVIAEYVRSGEPMDKAGSYGIQGLGGSFVSGINGCYHSVVGFPMHRFCANLDCAHVAASAARISDGTFAPARRQRLS